jgi:hypothetical protein
VGAASRRYAAHVFGVEDGEERKGGVGGALGAAGLQTAGSRRQAAGGNTQAHIVGVKDGE